MFVTTYMVPWRIGSLISPEDLIADAFGVSPVDRPWACPWARSLADRSNLTRILCDLGQKGTFLLCLDTLTLALDIGKTP